MNVDTFSPLCCPVLHARGVRSRSVRAALRAKRDRRRCRRPTSRPCAAPRRCLQTDPALRVLARHPSNLEPVEPNLERGLDHDHRRVFDPALGLHEQRHVVHHDRTFGRFGDAAQELFADRRMRDRFQFLARLVVDERLGREGGPVERPIGGEDVDPEPLDELGQGRGAGLDDFPSDGVGIHDDCATLREHSGNGRFPRPDSPRQPDHQHRSLTSPSLGRFVRTTSAMRRESTKSSQRRLWGDLRTQGTLSPAEKSGVGPPVRGGTEES